MAGNWHALLLCWPYPYVVYGLSNKLIAYIYINSLGSRNTLKSFVLLTLPVPWVNLDTILLVYVNFKSVNLSIDIMGEVH